MQLLQGPFVERPVLGTSADFPSVRPAADRPQLTTPAAVLAAFPAVKILSDGQEPPSRRPQGWDQQKPSSSGKKERHAVKNRVVGTTSGVPGRSFCPPV